MSDQLSIKLNIGGRTYPLTIDRKEEELVRKAANRINDNIKELQENYAVKDMQDLLAMTALMFANKSLSSTGAVESDKLVDALKLYDSELEGQLSK